MITDNISKNIPNIHLAITCVLVLLTGCQTPKPSSLNASDDLKLDSLKRDSARLFGIMGITARSYEFDLRPSEMMVVRFRSQKNGVDEKDDTFTREIPFPVYEKFDKNYPTFEPLKGKRRIDVEILEPGHTWNPDRIKISVRVPGFERYFYFERPKSRSTSLGATLWLDRNENHRLLELTYSYANGDVRTLTVQAEIETLKNHE